MIRLENVTVEHRGKTILDHVNMQVHEGEKVAVVGPSGAGKSSLLLTVAGAQCPTSGRVIFDGEAMSPGNVDRIRRAIAFVGQEPVLGQGTVAEAILMPFSFRNNSGNRPSDQTVHDVLRRLRLDPGILTKPAAVISGGEKQRVAVARALLLDKRVFLMDEVTSALDDDSKVAVLDLLARSSFTVVSVSHDADWIRRCERTITMDTGRIVEG